MTRERNALKAGLFIVISIALIIGVIGAIRGMRFGQAMQTRTVTFKLTDDVNGLRLGDEVRLGGYKVGVVRAIEVVQGEPAVAAPPTTAPTTAATTGASPFPSLDDGFRLNVTFTMPRRHAVRQDARVGVQSTLTGTSWLNIDYLGGGAEIPAEVALVGRPSPMNALISGLGEMGPELGPIARGANETITDVRGTVAEVRTNVVPKVGETVTNFRDAGGHMRDLLGDTKSDFRTTISNVADSTGTIKEKIPTTMDRLNSVLEKMDKTIADVQVTLEDVKKTVGNTREISASAKNVIVNNKGKLDAMIASLKSTGDNLKAASSEIRRSPWRLLYKPGAGEMANLNLYDSARQFADGAGSLSDAATALRDALANKDTDPAELQKLLTKLDESFAGFQEVEDKLWASVRE